MRRIRMLALAAIIPLTAACTTAFVPSSGNMVAIDQVDFTTIGNMKRGEACATTILGIFTQGDAMITTAARNAGISTVEIVEHKVSANPLFAQQCIIVFGT